VTVLVNGRAVARIVRWRHRCGWTGNSRAHLQHGGGSGWEGELRAAREGDIVATPGRRRVILDTSVLWPPMPTYRAGLPISSVSYAELISVCTPHLTTAPGCSASTG